MSHKRVHTKLGAAFLYLILILNYVNAQSFEPKNLRFLAPPTFSTSSLDSFTSNVKLVYEVSVQDLLCAAALNPQPAQFSNPRTTSSLKILDANQGSIELSLGIDCSAYSWPVYKSLASEAEHASLCYLPNISSKEDVPCVKYALSIDFDETQLNQLEVLQAFQGSYDVNLDVRTFSPSSLRSEFIEDKPRVEYSFDASHWQILDASTLTIPGDAFEFQRFEIQDFEYSLEDCPEEFELCRRMEVSTQLFYRVMITGNEPEMSYRFSVFIANDAIENLKEE